MKTRHHSSLRFRLGMLYAVLLVCSVMVMGIFSYWNIWQLSVENKAGQLRARAKPVIERWLEAGRSVPLLNRERALCLARDLTSRDAVAVVLDLHGTVLADGRRLPEEPQPVPPDSQKVRKALSGDNEVTYRMGTRAGPMLVALIPLRPAPGKPEIFGVVQLNAPLDRIYTILFRHGAMLLGLMGAVLLAGIALGFCFIDRSLEGLEKLALSCDRLSRGDFSGEGLELVLSGDEIGRLAAAFKRMMEKMEASFAAQKRFAANAAHELLTPLTGIRGSLDVLLRGVQDDPELSAAMLRILYEEVCRLIRLCERLLGFARLQETVNVRKAPLVLDKLVQEVENRAKTLAGRHPVLFRKGPYALVLADPDLLEQVFLNLLGNAFRHAPEERPVIVDWSLHPDHVEVRVRDGGKGMDARTLSRAFEPFFRGPSDSVRGERGAGLGLSLAKAVVEAHGGRIWIESRSGLGTTVHFTLPLAPGESG